MITQLLNYIAYPKALLLIFTSIGGICWLIYFIIYSQTKYSSSTGSIKNLYYSYTACIFFIILWVISNAYFHTELLIIFGESNAIFMAKIANVFSYMSLTFAFVYSCNLTSAVKENKIKLWEITLISIMTTYAYYVNFMSGDTITGVIIEEPSIFTIKFGNSTPIFFLSLFIYTFLTLFRLINLIKFSRTKIKQLQSIYTLSGMIVYLISTAVIHLIVTFIYDDFSLTWLPPFLAIICLSLVGYASIHHRFYSLQHLVHSGIKTIIVLISYILPIIVFTSSYNTLLSIIFIITWCLIYIYYWSNIKNLSAKIANLLIYKKSHSPIDKIQIISETPHNSLQEIIKDLSQTLKLEGELSIIPLDNESNTTYKKHLNQSSSALIIEEIRHQIDNNRQKHLKEIYYKMLEHKAAVILPIFDNNNSIYQLLVLPRKLNGFLYSNEEVQAIQYLLRKISFYLYYEYKINQSQKTAISIAYEMKAPLKEVQFHLSRLESEVNNLSHLLTPILDIKKSIQYGHQIISSSLNDINNISCNTDNKEYIYISELINTSVNDYAYAKQEDANRVFLDTKDDFVIYVNRTKFTFILFNLLKNATYYFESHPDSIIEIKTKSGSLFNKLYFKDLGPGIKDDIIDNIFHDYFTYKKHNGTGLGLSYCKRAMKAINGDIHCHSIYGEYSEFLLTFPNIEHSSNIIDRKTDVKSIDHNTLDVSILENKLDPTYNIRALVTDDNQTHRALARNFLMNLGVEVYEAQDGSQAVKMALHHTFDIIFMDVQMPKMDGFEASIKIKRSPLAPPIIALSGESGEKEVAEISRTMDDRMIKPAKISHFKEILQKWVISREKSN